MRRSLLLVVAAALALSACGSENGSTDDGGTDDGGTTEPAAASDGEISVAAFTAGYATPAGKYTMDLVVERGQELGWDITLYTSDFDYDALNNDMQTALLQEPDALIMGFPDPRAIGLGVSAARDAGVPLFSIDGGVEPNDDFVLDVSTSQEEMATLTVDSLIEAMGGAEGKQVMIIGHDPHLGIATRSRLAEEKLEAAGAEVVDFRQVEAPGTSQEEALNFVRDYLQANPDGLDGVWVGWDHAALGAVQTINEVGRDDIFVTGVDAMGIAVEEIKQNGPFYATVKQDWNAILDVLFPEMESYFETGELPDENFMTVPVVLVTRDNADEVEVND